MVRAQGGKLVHPPKLFRALRRVLRADVPYITVNQNDEGMTGKCELLMQDIPNVLVLSAGGYGHVPIPLFIRPEPENHATPVAQRPYLVSCAPRARAGRTARVRALRAAGRAQVRRQHDARAARAARARARRRAARS